MRSSEVWRSLRGVSCGLARAVTGRRETLAPVDEVVCDHKDCGRTDADSLELLHFSREGELTRYGRTSSAASTRCSSTE